jgi:hypothetical protein
MSLQVIQPQFMPALLSRLRNGVQARKDGGTSGPPFARKGLYTTNWRVE